VRETIGIHLKWTASEDRTWLASRASAAPDASPAVSSGWTGFLRVLGVIELIRVNARRAGHGVDEPAGPLPRTPGE